MSKDPVCGMMVDEKRAAATAVYQGTTYYFCGQSCKRAFDAASREIDHQKDALLGDMSWRLEQTVELTPLFTIRWSLA
jgi:YHS domain-containing protein